MSSRVEDLGDSVAGLPSGSEPRTMMMWIYVDSTTRNNIGVGGYGINSRGKSFAMALRGSTQWTFEGWGPTPSSSERATFDKWMHLTYTYDGSKGKFFLDGEYKAQVSVGSLKTPTSPRVVLGCEVDINEGVKGKMADMRIYNTVLSDADIAKAAAE